MHQHIRTIATVGLLGFVMLGFVPLGCATATEQLPVHRASYNRPRVPDVTAARLQECVDTYHEQLAQADYTVRYHVRVDEQGRVVDIQTNDIPDSAPDFAACTRNVLRDMALPTQLHTTQWTGTTNDQTAPARSMMGTVTAAGAEIALEELLAGAGGVNILFAISIGLAVSGVKDIADALDDWKEIKAACHAHYLACLESPLADKFGSVYNATRCLWCRDSCVAAGGAWPPRVPKARGFETCTY